MENIGLKIATIENKKVILNILNNLDGLEYTREEKIINSILNNYCYLILENNKEIGFIIFDYRFFDKGWIELLIINEAYRGKGICGKVLDLISDLCNTDKIFTSTNNSNIRMKKALVKANFKFAGKLIGLDEGDPEIFYYKDIKNI